MKTFKKKKGKPVTPECKGKWKVLRANAGETDRVR